MIQTVVELVLAPVLAAVATLASRRWGARVGGVVSAFPAIVGPVLLIAALQRGPAFAAQAANGTLLGLVALSGFALTYGRAAVEHGWRLSLAAGWACAALVAVTVGVAARGLGSPAGLVVAMCSLIVAYRASPAADGASPAIAQLTQSRGEIPVRMAVTALLVTLLASGASHLGPLVGGMLAALPVLASVLAVFMHREQGPQALIALLRGMLAGMAGFVVFCELLAVLIVPSGAAPAFAAATVVAMIVQTITAYTPTRSTAARRRTPSLSSPR